MNFQLLKNHKGLTLTELIVAMGLTSVLTIIVITGSLFIQKYINRWTGESKLMEEALFIQSELTKAIENAQVTKLFSDSLVCISKEGDERTYSWGQGNLVKSDKELLKMGFKVDYLAVSRIQLPGNGSTIKLSEEISRVSSGLYLLRIAVSEKGKSTDTLTALIKNQNEYLKFIQK